MKFHRILKRLLVILFILYSGCAEFNEPEKFKRPDWLPGKLYTAVSVQGNLSMFAECLRLAGLDTILNVSGCWTVFAPTNEAMQQYLAEHQYASLSDIPPKELERIAEFHVVQNPWTLEQLQSLGPYGWRSGNSSYTSAYAYKRQTILKNPVGKYWIQRNNKRESIVLDSTGSDTYKKVFVQSRKYVPIFYDGYMDINGLTSEDFRFYFRRDYEHGSVYYGGARILQADIFAENGFVHIIDRVLDPMLNAEEMLQRESPAETYKRFLEMVYWYYPSFSPNITATTNQPAVKWGGVVDTLWDLEYKSLAFDPQQELIRQNSFWTNEITYSINITLMGHNGLCAPTDDAFSEFLDGVLTERSGFPHWPDYRSLPQDIVKLIVPRLFTSSPLYPSTSKYREIFAEDGDIRQNEGDIIRKEFGSNCTFIGLNSYVPDRVFTSVTGPVYCRPAYSSFRLAMQSIGIDREIADHDGELCFFPISDIALYTDSSMILNWIDLDNYDYNFWEYDRSVHEMQPLPWYLIYPRILNHIGLALPSGSADKEFIPTLGGNYIIWNNSDNTVQGNRPCTVGYNGSVVRTCHPVPLSEPADNGKVWGVDHWFNFESENMVTILSGFPKFFNLMIKAGFFEQGNNALPFLNYGEYYTVFVPSDDALDSFQADTISSGELSGFIKHHFLLGALIFTDNKQPSAIYNTVSGASLNIRTGPDLIEILDNTGNPYISIPERENMTNIIGSNGSQATSVIHQIDKVLINF